MTASLKRLARAELHSPRPAILVLIVALVALFAFLNPSFLNGPFVIAPLLTSISIFAVVGLAQMAALSIGHMNIAVGQLAGIGALVAGASFDMFGMPLAVGLLLGCAAGAAVGAMAGWIIARTGVNSFIVTLALSFSLMGLIPTLYKAWSTGNAFTSKPAGIEALGRGTFADVCLAGVCGSNAVPLIVLPALLAAAAVWWFYALTRLGREVLMTGSNDRAAELSGVPTGRRVVLVHALSGLLAALAGCLLGASTGSFTPGIGGEFMLPSFLGPILGGTLLAGGAVSIVGTVLGITLTSVIRKGLELFGVGLETLNVLLGAILIIALSTDRLRELLANGRRRSNPRTQAPTSARTSSEVTQ